MPEDVLKFGTYQLDPRRGVLSAGGARVELSPLILRLLVYLAENRHRTVPVDELRTEVWRGVHVSEAAIHQAIRLARLAVGDDGRRQQVIRTSARAGYRFVAPIDARRTPAPSPSHPYVGRTALLEQLDESVSSAAAGSLRVLLVSGEPGIGKTRTLDEIDRRARAAGTHVARGAGSPHAGAPPFWPWIQVLRDLATARPVHALLRQLESLESDLPVGRGKGRPGIEALGAASQFRLFDEIARTLRLSAELGPVAILLDDLHDAGTAVFELFEFLARELADGDAVLIAASYRPVESRRSAARAAVIARVRALPNVADVKLEGLGAGEARELVAAHEPQPLEPVLLEALVDRARGNPFFLVELARDLADGSERPRSRREAALRIAHGVQRLIVARLAALPAATRHWLRTASALGLRFERRLVAELLPEVDGAGAMSQATAQGFVVDAVSGDGDLAFTHALVRDAVYAEIPEGERRSLHLRIAERIEQQQPVEAAFHFAEAAPLGGVERTVASLRHAAKVASAQFDAETAGALYQRAIDLLDAHATDGDADRCDLLIALGQSAMTVGRSEAAREALDAAAGLARRHGWGAHLATATLLVSDMFDYDAVAHEDLVRRLQEALDRLDGAEEALGAQLMARLAMEVRYEPDGADAAEALLARAIERARRADDVAARARTLEYATLVRWSAMEPERWIALSHELIDAAREAGDNDLVFRGILGLVTEHMQIGNRASMEREIARCAELAERFPAPFQRASCALMDTARHLLDGAFADAERGVRISLAANAPEAMLPSLTQLYALHLDTGRIEQLEDQMLALHEREPHRDSWKLALARLYAEVGQRDDARRYLAKVTRAEDIPRDRLWLPTVALMAEVVSKLGEKQTASELIDLLEPFAALSAVYGRGTLYYGSVSHFLGMLRRTVGDLGRAESHLLDALRVHEAMQSPPWQLRTQAERALVREAGGDLLDPVDVSALRERASALGMDSIATSLESLDGAR